MSLITTQELSKELGVTTVTIAKHCKAIGIRKVANTFILTPDQAAQVRKAVASARPGRPRKA